MIILAIDPGLDAAGAAVFDTEKYKWSSDALDLAACLVRVETIRTSPSDPLSARLTKLARAIHGLATLHFVNRAYVEQPAFAGTYQRNRALVGRDGMAANMAKLHLATGTLFGALRESYLDSVELVHAPNVPKEQRHLLARVIAKAAKGPGIPTRTPSVDALDAVWLGAQQLAGTLSLEHRRKRA